MLDASFAVTHLTAAWTRRWTVYRLFSPIIVAAVLATAPASAEALKGTVTAVHDGDTFTLDNGQKIRVFGIDAPELKQQCRMDAIHTPGPSTCVPCGEQSREALAGLILGKEMVCISRGKSYDRIVAECTLGKIEVGPWMLTAGQAVVYRQFLRAGDRPTYNGAEASAKRAGHGLWSETFIPPAEWRNHKQRLECERR